MLRGQSPWTLKSKYDSTMFYVIRLGHVLSKVVFFHLDLLVVVVT